MNNQLQSSGKLLSRRKFIAQTTAAAVGLSIVPRRVLGGPGYVSPSDKINMAFIGVGAQGFRVMLRFLSVPRIIRNGTRKNSANQSANCSASIPVGIGLAPTSRFS